MLDLAGGDESSRHRADRVLDRYIGVDAVDVIEVDHIGLEPREALVAALLDVFRPAISELGAALQPDIAEFAGDYVFVPMAGDRLGYQLLVAAGAVGVRAVEEIDAELARPADRRDPGRPVGVVVERRHRRAAEPDRRHLQRLPR